MRLGEKTDPLGVAPAEQLFESIRGGEREKKRSDRGDLTRSYQRPKILATGVTISLCWCRRSCSV